MKPTRTDGNSICSQQKSLQAYSAVISETQQLLLCMATDVYYHAAAASTDGRPALQPSAQESPGPFKIQKYRIDFFIVTTVGYLSPSESTDQEPLLQAKADSCLSLISFLTTSMVMRWCGRKMHL